MLKPNYKNNIINISATLAEYLSIESGLKKVKVLQKELKKEYKNVVFIILDSLGYYLLPKLVEKDNILLKNCKKRVTTVFPCTTANATTTFMSMMYPSEHKWIGWSMFMPEFDRCVDLFPAKDSFTDESVDRKVIIQTKPFDGYYNKNQSDKTVYAVFPEYVRNGLPKNTLTYRDEAEMFSKLQVLCENDNKKFVYCYHDNPDKSMHCFGVYSEQTKNCVKSLSDNIQKLIKNNPDTLVVISADHGHIDVEGIVDIHEDEQLFSMLKTKPFLGLRALAFSVKDEYKKEFKNYFKKNYGKDFKLYNTEKLIKAGVFGNKDLSLKKEVGDYIASGTKTNKMFKIKENGDMFKGFHDALTKIEISVPLIIIGNK